MADEQAKEAASEMSKLDVTVEPIFDKKEAVTEIKKQMITKWNLKFSCSETASNIQDVFSEVGKRSCERDRPTFSALNRLFRDHSILDSHRAKIDKNVSNLCETCQEVEDVEHFLFQCAKYSRERDTLERTVEDILFMEGCHDITCIDLRLLLAYNENISKDAQNELIAALMEFIRSSHRF